MKNRLGKLLVALRKKKGLSRSQVADLTEGMPEQLLRDAEEGRRPINAEQCVMLATLFGVPPEALMDAAQEFHVEFWSAQGVRPETEITVGRTIPASHETSQLRDEVMRLRSDLADGLLLVRRCLSDMGPDSWVVEPGLAWIRRAEAALKRADAILGANKNEGEQ